MAMKIKLTGDHETSIVRSQVMIDGKNIDCWIAYTDVPHDISRFKKCGWQQRFNNGQGGYSFISFEQTAIKISNSDGHKKRQLTEEQKELVRQRIKIARESKNKK